MISKAYSFAPLAPMTNQLQAKTKAGSCKSLSIQDLGEPMWN
jgi:hypothetical protein